MFVMFSIHVFLYEDRVDTCIMQFCAFGNTMWNVIIFLLLLVRVASLPDMVVTIANNSLQTERDITMTRPFYRVAYPSLFQCAESCLYITRCTSASFDMTTNFCRMFNATKETRRPSDVFPKADILYIAKNTIPQVRASSRQKFLYTSGKPKVFFR